MNCTRAHFLTIANACLFLLPTLGLLLPYPQTWLQSLHPGTLPKQDLSNSGEKQDASVPPDLDDPIHLTLQLPSASQACEQSPSRTSDLLFLIPVSDMTSATAAKSSKHRVARILCGGGVEVMMESTWCRDDDGVEVNSVMTD